jgi:hypothetical protein
MNIHIHKKYAFRLVHDPFCAPDMAAVRVGVKMVGVLYSSFFLCFLFFSSFSFFFPSSVSLGVSVVVLSIKEAGAAISLSWHF